jgi:hypothetical protein
MSVFKSPLTYRETVDKLNANWWYVKKD